MASEAKVAIVTGSAGGIGEAQRAPSRSAEHE